MVRSDYVKYFDEIVSFFGRDKVLTDDFKYEVLVKNESFSFDRTVFGLAQSIMRSDSDIKKRSQSCGCFVNSSCSFFDSFRISEVVSDFLNESSFIMNKNIYSLGLGSENFLLKKDFEELFYSFKRLFSSEVLSSFLERSVFYGDKVLFVRDILQVMFSFVIRNDGFYDLKEGQSNIFVLRNVKSLFLNIGDVKDLRVVNIFVENSFNGKIFVNLLKEKLFSESFCVNIFMNDGSVLELSVSDMSGVSNFVNIFMGERSDLKFQSFSVVERGRVNFKKQIFHLFDYAVSECKNNLVSVGGSIFSEVVGFVLQSVKHNCLVQKSQGFLFCSSGEIVLKPVLDVRSSVSNEVSHSANLFNFSEEELFYLLSRGITKREVKVMYIYNLVKVLVGF